MFEYNTISSANDAPTALNHIPDNAKAKYKGDVVVHGNIGRNVRFEIIDGSLLVEGEVGEHSKITLKQKMPENVFYGTNLSRNTIINSTVTAGGVELNIGGNHKGNINIGSNTLSSNHSQYSASKVKKTNAFNASTMNITIEGNVHCNSRLKTQYGNITVRDVYPGVVLNATGRIKANHVSDKSRLHAEKIIRERVVSMSEVKASFPIGTPVVTAEAVHEGGVSEISMKNYSQILAAYESRSNVNYLANFCCLSFFVDPIRSKDVRALRKLMDSNRSTVTQQEVETAITLSSSNSSKVNFFKRHCLGDADIPPASTGGDNVIEELGQAYRFATRFNNYMDL